jgi:hypothetical protein
MDAKNVNHSVQSIQMSNNRRSPLHMRLAIVLK